MTPPQKPTDSIADSIVINCIEAGFSCANGNHMWRAEIKDALDAERSIADGLRSENQLLREALLKIGCQRFTCGSCLTHERIGLNEKEPCTVCLALTPKEVK